MNFPRPSLLALAIIITLQSAFAGGAPDRENRVNLDAEFSALPQGNAAWVYDSEAKAAPAMWAPAIERFNASARSEHKISVIYSYGGDFEYEEGDESPFKTYFTPENQKAAEIYKKIQGVKTVIAVVDGRMDGGESYSPDLSKFTPMQVQTPRSCPFCTVPWSS